MNIQSAVAVLKKHLERRSRAKKKAGNSLLTDMAIQALIDHYETVTGQKNHGHAQV